ncbi:MAG: hypothetical protein H7Z38_03105, partial [Rubrivivax sp.]|nr:hypothetical protein [Pyrinomonadaceae bacterium]
MPRKPQARKIRQGLIILSAVVAASVLIPLATVWALSALSAPVLLPGDVAPAPAAGAQEGLQIAKGADTYLAVWVDTRTMLTSAPNGTGVGTQKDIYAARIGADGQVIDTIPIVIDESGLNESAPAVGWNGQNWLVVWHAEKQGQYSAAYEVRAARVSPAGQLLDQTPIVLKADADSGTMPFQVIDDGAGNWVVMYEEYLPAGGGSRGVLIMRVAGDGTILDPGGRVVYNQWSLTNPRIARAGDRYLLTFIEPGPPYVLKGVTLGASFNQLRNGPEVINPSVSMNTGAHALASDGNAWFVTWTNGGTVMKIYGSRVTRDGDPADGGGIVINSNAGGGTPSTRVCWDGEFWFVAYNTTYDHATQTYTNDNDISLSRVTGAGAVLDPTGIKVKVDPNDNQLSPGIAPGVTGGAQVTWQEQLKFDIHTAQVSREGAVGTDVNVAMGAPRQTEARMAASGNGFLAVFRSETSVSSRIMAQRLDASGTPVDSAPFVISDQPTSDNPSVAWNGSNYLVVWDQIKPPVAGENLPTPLQTFGRIVPATSGAPLAPEFFIMAGDSPDAAAQGGTFLVVNAVTKSSQLREVQFVRLSGAGTPVATPQMAVGEDAIAAPGDSGGAATPSTSSSGPFSYVPRVAAFGNRWLAVWQYHPRSSNSTSGAVHASFVEQDGTVQPSFVVSGGTRPHLAVAGEGALIVWSGGGDIRGILINADGSLPGTEMPLASAPATQTSPAVTWDGNQYILVWSDYRNQGEGYPKFTQGDIYAARIARTNVSVEEIVVADSPLPEETPFVISANGLTVFSYARFYDDDASNTAHPPLDAYHTTLRTARFAAPDTGDLPAPPSNLVVTQINNGPATGTATLAWRDNSGDETNFKVESGAAPTSFSQIKLLPANTTALGNVSAASKTQGYFRVRAFNAAGNSAYSNVGTAPVAFIVAPNEGSGGTYNFPSNVPITVSATDPDGIALVEIYASRDPLDGETIEPAALIGVGVPGANNQYNFTWVAPPAGYYHITAKALDTAGSSTVTYGTTVFIKQKPSALITAPTEGSVFKQPVNITPTASAQTNNNRSDEHIARLDFYNGTRWIGQGTNTAWQAPWNFTWTNAPAGTHTITAHATSSWGDIGISPPLVIVVEPETPPDPDLNIKPVVALVTPLPLAHFAAGDPVVASAVATDEDGTISRVEFRANGQIVETDTTEPYAATLNLPGGAHSITAVAFDNRGGSTTSLAAAITIDRTAGAQLTSN